MEGMIANSRLYREVRQFATTTPVWGTAIRVYSTPADRWDLTQISQRVYGNRNEALVVMAAAGLDRVNDPLPEMELVLPTPAQLEDIKRRVGAFEAATRPGV